MGPIYTRSRRPPVLYWATVASISSAPNHGSHGRQAARRRRSSQRSAVLCHSRDAAVRRTFRGPFPSQCFVCSPLASPPTGILAREVLHVSLNPRVRYPLMRGQGIRFVAAVRRPTRRRSHMTATAASTGGLPTWLRTQRSGVRVGCRQNTKTVFTNQHLSVSSLLSSD